MWQAVLDMMNRKDHLKVGGIELKIRELQRHNRAFIHPIVLNAMMHLRPDLGERLRDRDIVQTPTSDLSLKNSLWDKEVTWKGEGVLTWAGLSISPFTLPLYFIIVILCKA